MPTGVTAAADGWRPPLALVPASEDHARPPASAIWTPESDRKTWPDWDDPDAAWHGPLGRVVRAIEPETEADPKLVGLDLLVSIGNVIGHGPHAIADGSRHDCRLFALGVGDTSKARKGTSQAHVLGVCAHIDPEWHASRQLRGVGSGEGLIDFAAGRITARGAVNPADQEGADKRTMVREGEFARILAAAGRDGSTLSSVLRDAWDQETLSSVTRSAQVTLQGGHISVMGHITAFELGERMSRNDMANGFANRFLWACVRRSKLLPSGGLLTPDDYRALAGELAGNVSAARRMGLVRRSTPAEALWATLYAQMAADDPGGVEGLLTARAEAQVLRLSLLLALIDGARCIDVVHLEQAWQWWTFCRRSVAYLFGGAGVAGDAGKLLDALRAAGPAGLTATVQYRRVFGSHRTADQVAALREDLAARGLIWSAQVAGADGKLALTTWAVTPGWAP